MMNRRHFLKASSACAALLACPKRVQAGAGSRKIPVGIQLYSFREQAKVDFTVTLQKAAEIGFSGVEFAGYGPFAEKPAELRKILDGYGLKAFGTHTGFNLVQPEALKKTMDFHATIGCKYIIIPWIDPKVLSTKEACLKTAEQLSKISETVQKEGLYIGYHAHGGDFRKVDGALSAWELLFDNTPKAFIHQIDLGNCLGGGGDPFKMIERYPGRSLTVHLKEHGGPEGAVFGQGTVDFKRALKLCEKIGGTTCYIIEHESNPAKAYESAKACLDYIKKI